MTEANQASPDMVEIPLIGRLDAYASNEIEARLLAGIRPGIRRMLLDLRQLEFVSSAGIRVLITVKKRLLEQQAELGVYGFNEYIGHLFHMSGLNRTLAIYASRDDALKGGGTGGGPQPS